MIMGRCFSGKEKIFLGVLIILYLLFNTIGVAALPASSLISVNNNVKMVSSNETVVSSSDNILTRSVNSSNLSNDGKGSIISNEVVGFAADSLESLMGWYRLEGNPNDYSGQLYHGIVYGNPATVSGSVNDALEFDGIDDYILIPDYYPEYPITGDDQSFTITAWVKTSDTSGNHWVIGNEKGWSMFMFGLKEGKLVLYWRYGPSSKSMCVDTGQTIAGEFTHIAAVYDASDRNVYVYINGELAASDTTTKPLGIKTEQNLTIGRGMSKDTGEMFKGIIDEVRIYNIPLSSEEIQFLGKDSYRDTDPPSTPTSVNGTADSSVHITIDWDASSDNESLAGYRILRGEKELVFLDTTEYVDYEVTGDTSYSYTVCAYDNSGNESRSSNIIVNTPSANNIHPRLFFTSDNVSDIRQKARTSHASICEKVIDKADGLLTSAIPDYPGIGSYSKIAESPLDLAFAYLVTGENKYLNRAKEYLLTYSSWPSWGDDSAVTERDYPMAYMTIGVALSYDWLYNSLTDTERTTIRTAIGKHVQELYVASSGPYKSEYYNWWRRSYLQNHFTQCVAAIGIGSLAIEDEDSRASIWLAHALKQSMRTKALYDGIADGSWHEGIYYQHSGQFLWVLPFYYVLEQTKGVSLYSDTYFNNYLYWTLYNYRPESKLPVLPFDSYVPGWGGWTAAGSFTFPRSIDAKYRTGYGTWLTEHLIPNTVRNQWHSIAYIFEFFYYDPSLDAVDPDELPLSRTFSDAEAVIWRTGWNDDDLIFGLKTGPLGGRFVYNTYFKQEYPLEERDIEINVGHDHQCAGTFYLYKGGADLASEMPDRHNNVLGESVHNVIMIDGKGQYKASYDNGYFPDTDGKLEFSYGTKGYDFLVTDLRNCYREKNDDNVGSPGDWILNGYKRHVLFVRPGYLIMLDNLSSDSAHQYDWVCHFSEEPKASTVVEDDWVKSTVNDEDNNVLGIKVLSPTGFKYEFGESEHPYSGDPPKTKPYIRIQPESNINDTQFVTVFYPTTSTSWSEKPDISLQANTGEAVLVRVNQNGIQDHIIRYGSNATVEVGKYNLTGQNISVTKDNSDNLQSVFMGNSKYLADNNGDRVLVDSKNDITIEINYSGGRLSINGDSQTSITIYAPGIQEVFWNDKSVTFNRQGDYIYIMKVGPEIISSPQSQTKIVGDDATFTVEAEGIDLSYQWQKDVGSDFINIADKTDGELTIYGVQKEDEGEYRVIVSNIPGGEVVSEAAKLTVIDIIPEIEDFSCVSEYNSVYLSWDNPAGQGESWDNVLIKRLDGSVANPEYEDGTKVYDGEGASCIDENLSQGTYTYVAYTYKETDTNPVYSEPAVKTVDMSDTTHTVLRIYPGEKNSLVIGQNTKGDLYSSWNISSNTLGVGPGGNATSLWVYNGIIGTGVYQIPTDSEIVSARLVYSVEKTSFYNQIPSKEAGNFNVISKNSRSIKIYQIIDTDELGMPYYAEESGIRNGLDFEYRDHRPGVNKPWVNPGENESENNGNDNSEEVYGGIEKLFADQKPLDIIEFSTATLSEDLLDTIEFNITDAVKSWVNGEANQGLYISTGQGRTGDDWNNGEMLKLFGAAAKESDESDEQNEYTQSVVQQEYLQQIEQQEQSLKQEEYGKSVRPYLEIVYGNSGSDLTAPGSVENLSITTELFTDTDIDLDLDSGTDSEKFNVILNWINPDNTLPANTDFAGVKLVRKEGMLPFNHMDGDKVIFLEDENNAGVPEEFTDTELVAGKTYYYTLYTYDKEHNYSDSVWIKVTPGSPVAPSFDGEPSIITGKVSIKWNSVTGADGYRLYREDVSGELIQIVNSENGNGEVNSGYINSNLSNYDNSTGNVKCVEINDGSASSFDDYLQLGTYKYWITAYNDNGESPFSSEIEVEINENNKAAIIPAVPTELIEVDLSNEDFPANDELLDGLDINNSAVKLTWADNSNNESGFVIERVNEAGEWEEIATTVYNVTTYIDRGLKPGTEYQYRIKSVNSKGESAYAEYDVLTNGIADISWEVISSAHVRIYWKDRPDESSYTVKLMDLEGNMLDTKSLLQDSDYCIIGGFEPGEGCRVEISAEIDSNVDNECVSYSDIIRTSADAKGGLF